MQQHGRKYFAPNPPPPPSPTLGMGSVCQIQHFYNMLMLHNLLKRITNALAWGQIFCLQTLLPTPPPPDPRDWVSRSKFIFFSIWSYIAYQMKGNREMQQLGSKHFVCRRPHHPYPLPPSTPQRWGWGVSRFLFIFFRTWSCDIST